MTITNEMKKAIKAEAKDLKINVVGKSIDTLLDLIDAATGRSRELTLKVMAGEEITDTDVQELLPEPAKKTPRKLADPKHALVRKLAETLKIPFSKTTPYADLRFAVADAKGWANESEEVIDFLINGGAIEEVPGFVGIAPKPNNRETSAGGKVEPEAPKKAPRKVSKAAEKAPKKPAKEREALKADREASGEIVTIQSICKELNVEGRVARRKLRGSDIVKPGDSWTWEAGHADIQRVKELLKK